MNEYRSLRASTYDVDSLIDRLNEADSDGWELVTIVPASGDLVAIVRRAGTGGSTTEAIDAVAAAPVPSPASADNGASTVEATDATVKGTEATVEATDATVIAAAPSTSPSPVDEPPGWGAEPAPAPEPDSSLSGAASSLGSSDGSPAGTATQVEAVAAAPVGAPTSTAAQPVVTTPAGWYPDPSTRFELRYWNGTTWTEHVARGGQQYTDPPVA